MTRFACFIFHFSFPFLFTVFRAVHYTHNRSHNSLARPTDRSIDCLLANHTVWLNSIIHWLKYNALYIIINLTVFLPFYSFPSRFWTHKHTNISLESNEDVNKTKKYGIWMFLSNAQWEANEIEKNLFLLLEKKKSILDSK